jgi:cytochrome c-type biogenesis protein CcmH/NrfF
MFWITVLVIPAAIFTAIATFTARRWALWAGGVIVLLVLSVGVSGTIYERRRAQQTIDMLAETSQSEREMAREAGVSLASVMDETRAEANRPIQFAAVVSAVCGFGLVTGFVRRRVRSSDQTPRTWRSQDRSTTS